MPYHIERAGNQYLVKYSKGKVYSIHKTRAEAQAMMYELAQAESKERDK